MRSVAVVEAGKVRLVDDVPIPTPGDYEALVRVRTCGFCNGTDLQIINGTLPAHEGMKPFPTILGHEGAGEVVELGRRVRNIRVGDRFLHPNLRDQPGNGYTKTYGGMSEYGLVVDYQAMLEDGCPENSVPRMKFARVPKELDFADISMLLSLSESLSAVRNFGIKAGMSVLVYGAGPMGQAMMSYMRLLGAGWIAVVDRLDTRLRQAEALCQIDQGINSEKTDVRSALGNRQFDVAIDAVGASPILLEASSFLKPGGRVGSMGVLRQGDTCVDITRLKNNTMIQLLNLPYGEYSVMEENLRLIQEGKINPKRFYSHVIPMGEIETCIELVRTKKALKVILSI